MVDAEVADVAFDADHPFRRDHPIPADLAAGAESAAVVANLAVAENAEIVAGAANARNRATEHAAHIEAAPVGLRQRTVLAGAELIVDAKALRVELAPVVLDGETTGSEAAGAGDGQRPAAVNIEIKGF